MVQARKTSGWNLGGSKCQGLPFVAGESTLRSLRAAAAILLQTWALRAACGVWVRLEADDDDLARKVEGLPQRD